jgi:hypothetical protein
MNHDDSAIIMRKTLRRLHAVFNQCVVSSVRQHVKRAILSIEAAQRALAKSREANDARSAALTPPPPPPPPALMPATADDFILLEHKTDTPLTPRSRATIEAKKENRNDHR